MTIQDDPKRDDNIVICIMSVLSLTRYQTIFNSALIISHISFQPHYNYRCINIYFSEYKIENNQNVLFFRQCPDVPRLKAVTGRPLKNRYLCENNDLLQRGKRKTHQVTATYVKRSKQLTKRLLFRLTDDDGHCKSANGSGVSETGRRRQWSERPGTDII